MRWILAWAATAIIALLVLAYPVNGEPVVRVPGPTPVPVLKLQLGFGGTVVPVAADWHGISTPRPGEATPPPSARATPTPCPNGASDPKTCAEFIPVSAVTDANENRLKLSANANGLLVTFNAALPFVSMKTLSCTQLRVVADSKDTALVTVVARTGERLPYGGAIYDGARAECDIGSGFAYALSAEKQSLSNIVPAGEAGAKTARTVTIPWKLLRIDSHTTSIMVAMNVCAKVDDCSTAQVVIEVPVETLDMNASLSLQYGPYVRVSGPTPAPGSTPMRLHHLGVDGSYSWDVHDLLMAAFAQDQSVVTAQRALSQAQSLTPLSLPMSNSQMTISQTLQTRAQPLFSFAEPAQRLNDDSLKPLFDLVPFSVSKLGSLAAGYAYGYDAQNFKFAGLYGNQARGIYAGGETVTIAFATPVPSPEPTLLRVQVPHAAIVAIPLKAPPPPAPFFESGSSNDLPAQIVLQNGYVGSKGGHDNINAIAVNGHIYNNATTNYQHYQALTVDLFGRLMQDSANPTGASVTSASSQFAGESASFTTAAGTSDHPGFFQFKETIAGQMDDYFFAPSAGSITWLTALNGSAGHVTASYASGDRARYYAVDLMGFRMTNVYSDVATQAGWQVTIPVPLGVGWLFTAGSLTQTVSDRIAALEQGLVGNYAAAIPEVIPTPAGAHGAVPVSPIRPQYLDNASLLSPWIDLTPKKKGDAWNVQMQFTGGYNIGDVTGCGPTPASTTAKPLFACQTQRANHAVAGLFFQLGSLWNFGATDTSALPGSISAGGASRNLGTSGALPGSVTGFMSYGGCPKIQVAYTNAAFPAGVPLPQQGNTLSGQLDYPMSLGALQVDVALGYFNEHPIQNSGPSSAGAFAALRLTASRPPNARC